MVRTGKPSFKPLDLAPPLVRRRDLGGGAFELFSPAPLRPHATTIVHLLRQQAQLYPERDFLAQRDDSGAWQRLTFAAASRQADSIAQALLDRGCGPERPVMILSGNGIDHAVLTFGSFVAGVPAVPVSVAYSLMSQGHDRLRHIHATIRPRVIYAASGKLFSGALSALDLSDCEVVVGADPPEGVRAVLLSELLAVTPTGAVERAFAEIGGDTIAKVLFTSGSTGMPKGVINTHRMMCANQMMAEQTWPFLKSHRLVLVDWLPWNHTFGGNHNLNLALAQADRDFVGLLAWPSIAGMKEICSDPTLQADPSALIASDAVRDHVRKGLRQHNAAHAGSSTQIRRVLLMTEPASIDANEITDKGYINQRATLERRREIVERVYAEPAPPEVIVIE